MLFDLTPGQAVAVLEFVTWAAVAFAVALAVALSYVSSCRRDAKLLEQDIDRLADRVKGLLRENEILRYRLGLVVEGKLKPFKRPDATLPGAPVKPAPEEQVPRGAG